MKAFDLTRSRSRVLTSVLLAGALLVTTTMGAAQADEPTEQSPLNVSVPSGFVPAIETGLTEHEISVGEEQLVPLGRRVDRASSALVRVSLFDTVSPVAIFNGGAPVLRAPAGVSVSTSVVLPVVSGGIRLSADAAVRARVEVLAAFASDAETPGSVNVLPAPVTKVATADGIAADDLSRPFKVGLIGSGGVPNEGVRAVFATVNASLAAAGTVRLGDQDLTLPAGPSSVTTVVVPSDAGEVTVASTSSGDLSLEIRAWVSEGTQATRPLNVTGSLQPVLTDPAVTPVSAGSRRKLEMAGRLDSAWQLVLGSASPAADATAFAYAESDQGRTRGAVIDPVAGAMPQLMVADGVAPSVHVFRGSTTVRTLSVAEVAGEARPGLDSKTTVSFTSPSDGASVDISSGSFTLTGQVESEVALSRVEVLADGDMIGFATVRYAPTGMTWSYEVDARTVGRVTYTVRAVARSDARAISELSVELVTGGGTAQGVELSVPRGSVDHMAALDGFSNLEVTEVTPAVSGVAWEANGDRVMVAVEMSASEGKSSLSLSGIGCTVSGCDQPWSLRVTLTVTGIEAADDLVLDEFPTPSPDRAAKAQDIGGGVAVMRDEVTIVLKDAAGDRRVVDAIAASADAVIGGGHQDLGIYLLRWDTQQDIKARLGRVIADPRVASVEGNLLSRIETTNVRNVPGYSDEDAYGDGDRWHLDLINAPDAWQKATGKGVKLGIYEFSHVSNHEDLTWRTHQAGDSSWNVDDENHANHVAGLACAMDNGKGVIGVAHGCDLLSQGAYTMVIEFSSSGRQVEYTYMQGLFGQLKHFIDAGPRVINASIGAGLKSNCAAIQSGPSAELPNGRPACTLDDKRDYDDIMKATVADWTKGGTNAFVTLMTSAPDTLLVVSAGNTGMATSTNWWSTGASMYELPNVLTVASVDENKRLSYFSNFGAGVTIAAPGGYKTNGGIVTYGDEQRLISTLGGNGYGRMVGTSMAAPMVAGTAALVAELHEDWTAEQIAKCLIDSSAQAVTERNDRPANHGMAGHQFRFNNEGYSIPLLDAAAAVNCGKSEEPTDPETPTDPEVSTATQRVSVASDGTPANYSSGQSAISADGRWVTYRSWASNLVDNDTNNTYDVFVSDRVTGDTRRVSVASDGTEANGSSGDVEGPAISADGRWITYQSWASNLVPNDTNNTLDVFVWDRETGDTRRVSVASDGTEAEGGSYAPAISADGRWITYHSMASNLVAYDTVNAYDVFVWDRETRETRRVSVASNGTEANGTSWVPAISADGRWITYESKASNLVADDTNNAYDVFVWDRETRETRRVSVASGGTQGDDISGQPAISADGRWITYDSEASNLVADDTNNTWDVFVWDGQTGETRRVTATFDDTEAEGGSFAPEISADGRWITYYSGASNLVANDTNNAEDVFVWDRQTRETRRVSVASDGTEAKGSSYAPSINADGRWITYESSASNLVADDTSSAWDVFVSANPLAR